MKNKQDIFIDRCVWIVEAMFSTVMAGVTIYGAVALQHKIVSTALAIAAIVWISFAVNDAIKLYKHIKLYKEESDGSDDTRN